MALTNDEYAEADLSLEGAIREALNGIPTQGVSDAELSASIVFSDSVTAWIRRQVERPATNVTVNVNESAESIDERKTRAEMIDQMNTQLEETRVAAMANGDMGTALGAIVNRIHLNGLIR